jgi:hypothetical protein
MNTTTLTATMPINPAPESSFDTSTPHDVLKTSSRKTLGLGAAALLVWIAATLTVLTGRMDEPIPSGVAKSPASIGAPDLR